jgi:hypothetical protein
MPFGGVASKKNNRQGNNEKQDKKINKKQL